MTSYDLSNNEKKQALESEGNLVKDLQRCTGCSIIEPGLCRKLPMIGLHTDPEKIIYLPDPKNPNNVIRANGHPLPPDQSYQISYKRPIYCPFKPVQKQKQTPKKQEKKAEKPGEKPEEGTGF